MTPLDPGLAIYAAAAVALVVWVALFAYLWSLDRRAREMSRLLDEHERQSQEHGPGTAPALRPTDTRGDRDRHKSQNRL